MKILRTPQKSANYLATIAIGEEYLTAFERFALESWLRYVERHDLGLVLFDTDLVSRDSPKWKKPTWQKLLIPEFVLGVGMKVNRVCYLDTDILISDLAPNIFVVHDPKRVGVVSVRTGLPFPHEEVLRRIAVLRHFFSRGAYPLDSGLFASRRDLYEAAGLPVQDDEFCAGMVIFDANRFRELFRTFFDSFDSSVKSPTDGGDQMHLNYLIQANGIAQWLDYRFQALWVYEVAWNYPFLFSVDPELPEARELIRVSIEASLWKNHFLHFAGSWDESAHWKATKTFTQAESIKVFERLRDFLGVEVSGELVGTIKPQQKSSAQKMS